MSHVIVIGAGIVGVSTALWCRRKGHEVTLIDREGPAAGASQGNAGLIASASIDRLNGPGLIGHIPRYLASPDAPLFLRWRALPAMAPWLVRFLAGANRRGATRAAAALDTLLHGSFDEHRALAAGSEAEAFLVPSDYTVLYPDRAAYEADAFSWELQRAHGWQWQELEGQDVGQADPLLAQAGSFAARLPDHGYVTDPGAYVTALARQLEREGGELLRAEVTGFVHEGELLRGVRMGPGALPADAVVVTAGAWSRPLARALGLRMPLETERGYHVELWEPSVVPQTPVMVQAGKFVLTPMRGRLRAAGIVELGGLSAPPSPAPIALIRRQLARAFPGLSWARETSWMGFRPTLPDSLPAIGPVPGRAGAWLGFGHQHVGLTGGPRTGRWLAALISGEAPNADLSAFAPGRFGRRPLRA